MSAIFHELEAIRAIFNTPASDQLQLPSELKPLYKPSLKRSAVLVPLFLDENGKVSLLLTKRALHLKHHPGQISFPGGRQDPTDNNAIDTALRETKEEVGISEEDIEIIGSLPEQPTATGFVIKPIIGIITTPIQTEDLTLSIDEVAEAFSAPLEYLFHEDNQTTMQREYQGHSYTLYSIPYRGHDIWGATAGLIMQLQKRLLG